MNYQSSQWQSSYSSREGHSSYYPWQRDRERPPGWDRGREWQRPFRSWEFDHRRRCPDHCRWCPPGCCGRFR